MSDLYEIPTFRFSGSSRQIGLAQGETFKEKLHELIHLRFEHTSRYKKRSVSHLKQSLSQKAENSWKHLKLEDPLNYEKNKAIIHAAGVDRLEFLIAASITDYRDISMDPEGCTSLVVRNNHSQMIGAQTWDLAEENMPYVIMIHELPEDSIERWTLNCYGFPPLMGMNSKGVSIGTTNIKTRDVGEGLGYVHLIDKALNQESARCAIEQFRVCSRMASHTYWVVDEKDGFQLDTSHRFYQCIAYDDEALVRTNHPTIDPLKNVQLAHPSLSSLMRKTQAENLLTHNPCTVKQLKSLMSDRQNGKESISRMIEDGTGITTNSCFIALPEQRKVWACRGPAQKGIWKSFNFDETYDKKESA